MQGTKTRSFINKSRISVPVAFVSCLIVLQLITKPSFSQAGQQTTTVIAGPEYKKSGFYQSLWGKHYRKEWTTPVKVNIAILDTLEGGLTPYEIGGSRQTKSLRLKDKNNREYVLRSVDKTFTGALPEVLKGSIGEKIANDQVSIAHPYSALTIAPLAEAAGIYHTKPRLYFIPKQKALDTFNEEIGDRLYYLEQRPDENWETAANFGYSKDIKSTDKTMEKILKDNDDHIDQVAFVRARLFDMVIGDWGRHEDQWRWAAFEDGKITTYKPIPRDRDQAYTKFDGKLLRATKGIAASHLESFGPRIKNIGKFNFPARNLDRHFLNELSLEQWKSAAADIQRSVTDEVIDNALKQMPPEVYNISAAQIAANIKSRRNHLLEYAVDYYKLLAKQVDVTGSKNNEFFEIKRKNDNTTEVNIYKITNKGNKKDKPFYSRIFHKNETQEVRLYGIGGEDEYEVSGNVDRGIVVRLIGGDGKDKFTDRSRISGYGHKTKIYDDPANEFVRSGETIVHTSRDSSIHAFKYAYYKFDKQGFRPLLLYNFEDRFYAGIAYTVTRNKWRKEPFGFKQYFDVKYSFNQNALSTTYKSTYVKLVGPWDAVFYGNYDFVRWNNFFGLGNDTKNLNTDQSFNRMRTAIYIAEAGVERRFGKYQKVYLNGFFQGIDIINDTSRFIAKTFYNSLQDTYENKIFTGGNLGYVFQNLNDSVLPTKGFSMLMFANYTHNIYKNSRSFWKFGTEYNLYIPFTKKIGLFNRAGVSTVTGTPEFYQYNRITSSATLRGYRRDRFYGNTAFFNQNELRWITNAHSLIYNGKIGFFGFYDVGRVWLKNESSNTLHQGYGGGLILSPYNRVSVIASYGRSPEGGNIHLALVKHY